MANKKWIQEATKNKGALRKKAAKQGLIKGDEKLSMADLNKLEKEGGKTAKQASLAKTLRTFADGGVIASNIIMQLGGFSRLQIMLGAYNFVDRQNGLSFKIKNPKANYIKITLNAKDLYDIEIGRIRGNTYKVVYSQEDVYAVDLRKIIEKHTGMYMAFKDGGNVNDVVLEDAYYREGYTDEETLILSQADKLANGGITAMEVLEAREFVGEKDWVKMKPKERLAATRYLIRTGKIGYYAYASGGFTSSFAGTPARRRVTMAKGSYTKKYKIKYLIGYSDEEEGLKYHESFYYADSKDVAALEAFDRLQSQGYTHVEILSITLVADKGMEVQSDEQLMQKYMKLKGNVPDWFRDMPTRYKVEIIDEIEDGYEDEKPEGDEFAMGGSISSKRERVVDYYINNEDDETLSFEFDIPDRALENRDKYYKDIFEKISDQFGDEDIYYKFRELNLDEASEEPDEDFADGGQMSDKVNVYVLLKPSQYYISYGENNDTSNKKYWYKINGYPVSREYAKQMADKYLQKYNLPLSDYKIGYVRRYGRYEDGGNIEATIKQRLSKSFELPLQMAVYVPSTKDKNVVISKKELAYRVKVVEKYLATLFGGFNSAKVDGGFQSVDKGVIKEDAVRVVAFANPEGFELKFEKLVNKVKEWCRLWSQESIGLEFENDLFYIEQNSKFYDGGMTDKDSKEMINVLNKIKSDFDSFKPEIMKWYSLEIDKNNSSVIAKFYERYWELNKKGEPDRYDLVRTKHQIRDWADRLYWRSNVEIEFSYENREYDRLFKFIIKVISIPKIEPKIEPKNIEEKEEQTWTITYSTENDDTDKVWVYGRNKDEAIENAKDEYWDIKEIISVEKMAKGGKIKNPSPDYPDFISMQYAKGGKMAKKPAKFKDKVKAISKSLEGKKVPKRVRKDYGATYDKKESMDAAKRIAGSMAKKERKRYEI